MNISQIYIAVSIITLAIVALIVFSVVWRQKEKRLSPLVGLAFGFVLAGILFGEDRFIGYSLLGVGVILSVIDMFRLAKSR